MLHRPVVGSIPVFVLTLALMGGLAAAQTVKSAGKVERVTLYRGQAMVTRSIVVEGEAGGFEVVVEGLPEQVVPSSLFAEAPEGVEVRAVRFRSTAVAEEPRDDIRAIDQKLEELADRT